MTMLIEQSSMCCSSVLTLSQLKLLRSGRAAPNRYFAFGKNRARRPLGLAELCSEPENRKTTRSNKQAKACQLLETMQSMHTLPYDRFGTPVSAKRTGQGLPKPTNRSK
ncbi:hypothetical protein [Rhizobium halophytocola]|uniref:Uncharacterized protein n=1 Tax=Rhizobium halophytocola TaxID=735519 RepID=A0ABS4E6M6_9HYPH|nr:hypothetical protein [Rhizobium halophytocola]MBP1853589.1 hypothetical protein [Rhizobium halophytocola]